MQTIHINDKDITVAKLPLGRYAEFVKALKPLTAKFDAFSGKENSEILAALPEVISNAIPETIHVLAVVTQVSEEEIANEWGLEDLITVFIAVVQENRFLEAYDKVKKALARPTSGAATM